jgi:hypothetical protein
MKRVGDGLRSPVATCAVLGLLVLGGCGSDDDGSDGAAAQKSGTTAVLPEDAMSPTTPDEEAIVSTYGRYTDAMASANAKGACQMMTRAMQRSLSTGRGCVTRMEEIFDLGTQSQNTPYIVTLAVDGKRAKARVKVRLSKETQPVGFIKQPDGEWKLAGAEPRG